MNYLSSFKKVSRAKKLGVLLVGATLMWTIGIPAFFTTASAANVSLFSMTASTSVPSASGNFRVQYTSTTTVSTGQSIAIQLSYGNSGGAADEYTLGSFTVNDATSTSMTIITAACGAVTPNQVSINGGISNSAGNRTITLTACGAISVGQKTIWLINDHVTNPTNVGSYKIQLNGTQSDSGQTMTAIVNRVTVTAIVDTTFTFTVTGVASGQPINSTTTSTTTSATAIGFGTLVPGVIVTGAQDLTVTTNASNGFIVTVHEDQNLLSNVGADIDLFKDGAATAVPTLWTTPVNSLASENTWGHFGLTSNDTDLNGGEFTSGGGNKWAGNFFSTTTRTVFSHTGPSDGTTQDIGIARVGYQIQISPLQEAANDYVNHLIYVATPTF